jgi:excisionase family DNA binding protein
MISLTEAAERLSVNYRTIRRWIAAGRIDAVRVGPRLLKIDAAQLDRVKRPVGGGAA